MIGIDQEPNRETLAALNGALGEGNYAIAYEQTEHGIKAIVRTHETPSRSWHTRFQVGFVREQVDAVWQEFAQRIAKSEGKVEPEPKVEAKPEPIDNARVEGGTGTSEAAASGGGGGEHFESSQADAPGEGSQPDPKGSPSDPARR